MRVIDRILGRSPSQPGQLPVPQPTRVQGQPARIVVVKPGDVLVIGNVWIPQGSSRMEEVLTFFKDHFGLAEIVVFEDDIELAVQRSSGS